MKPTRRRSKNLIYNILIANQVGGEHMRYHAYIDLHKDGDRSTPVSCCAGLGTRLFGSLPEFIYSLVEDGVWVNLYADAAITWQVQGVPVELSMHTSQPAGGRVTLRLSTGRPVSFILRLRIPGWVKSPVSIHLGQALVALGMPGSTCAIERQWCDGDVLTFNLPLELRATPYHGLDAVPSRPRFAFEYGPLLLGLAGPLDFAGKFIQIAQDAGDPAAWFIPVAENPAISPSGANPAMSGCLITRLASRCSPVIR